jgi:hypothetical protein
MPQSEHKPTDYFTAVLFCNTSAAVDLLVLGTIRISGIKSKMKLSKR